MSNLDLARSNKVLSSSLLLVRRNQKSPSRTYSDQSLASGVSIDFPKKFPTLEDVFFPNFPGWNEVNLPVNAAVVNDLDSLVLHPSSTVKKFAWRSEVTDMRGSYQFSA